jgi:hypothetical protein
LLLRHLIERHQAGAGRARGFKRWLGGAIVNGRLNNAYDLSLRHCGALAQHYDGNSKADHRGGSRKRKNQGNPAVARQCDQSCADPPEEDKSKPASKEYPGKKGDNKPPGKAGPAGFLDELPREHWSEVVEAVPAGLVFESYSISADGTYYALYE